MEKSCDACGDGNMLLPVRFFSVCGCRSVLRASVAVDRKSMGHTVAERSWKDADFLCNSLYKAWRLWERVVSLAMRGNTISGRG
jgi:hypothetical protein